MKGKKKANEENGAHIAICGRTSHHEFDRYSEEPTRFWTSVNDTRLGKRARSPSRNPRAKKDSTIIDHADILLLGWTL
jgi:hypothetical protein